VTRPGAGPAPAAPPGGDPRRLRREFGAAAALAVAGGALALIAAGQTWVRLTAVRRPPLPPVTDLRSGGQVAPLVTATGLLLLAAAVALVATRGSARVAVGLLMAVAGGVLGWSGARTLAGRLAVDTAALSTVGTSPGVRLQAHVQAAWPVLAVVAGVLAVAAGLLVVLRGRSWPAMGRRYERPGPADGAAPPARAEPTDEERAAAAWRALDRGDDPTEEPPGPRDPASGPAEPGLPARGRRPAPGGGDTTRPGVRQPPPGRAARRPPLE
jgi:uncharacterized membrane protein (TIGR02234 family)